MSFLTKNMSFSDLCVFGNTLCGALFSGKDLLFLCGTVSYRRGISPAKKYGGFEHETTDAHIHSLRRIRPSACRMRRRFQACGHTGSRRGKDGRSVEKTTDYLTGKKPLEQGRKATEKLNKLQSDYNKKLENELNP